MWFARSHAFETPRNETVESCMRQKARYVVRLVADVVRSFVLNYGLKFMSIRNLRVCPRPREIMR